MIRTFTYDNNDIVEHYDKARELPLETYKLWGNAITRGLPCESISSVCDVGCGTGRLSVLLAEQFSVQEIGVDPSGKMLAQAERNLSNSSITSTLGAAGALPLDDDSVDVLFLSMPYHHNQSSIQAISEFKRVLRRSGYDIIRASTRQICLLILGYVIFRPHMISR